MTSTGSFRRRRLARELRRLREERDLKLEDVTGELGMAQSTLSRIELAQVDIRITNVRLLLDHYDVHGEEREALITLAREARQQGWWHVYGDILPAWFEVYVDLENEADLLRTYDNDVVNGLLQTEDYARALLTTARPDDDGEEIERRVALRMQRQERLTSGALRLDATISECVLHRPYGGEAVMTQQFARLAELGELRNVSLQVLPSAGGIGSSTGAFSLLEFTATDPTVVYLENEIGALYLEKPEQVRPYARLYDRLRSTAWSPGASIEHLARLAKE